MQDSAVPVTWPVGTGEMAQLIREYDWATTPLGPITAWSPNLRAAVDICLGSAVASYVWWGADLIQLYNDAALLINHAKHPAFLGQPAREAWADVWEEIGGLLEHVVTTGESVRGDNVPMVPDRNGSRETAWFTFSYGPARDETGAVAGAFCSAIETTHNVRAQQALLASEARQSFLLHLSDTLRPLADPLVIQETASRLLGEQLGADWVMYGEAVDNDVFVIHRAYRRDEAMPSPVGQHRFVDYGEYVASEFRAGRALIVPDVLKEPRHTERDLEQYAGVGVCASVAVPLTKGAHIAACLAVNQATPRAWSEAEVELVRGTAERTWAAVEQTRAEQALRLSEERLRAIVEEATDYAIFTADVDGRIDSWYAGAEAIFKWTDAEAIGQPMDITYTPEDRDAGVPAQERAIAREEGSAPNVRWHLRRDGTHVFIDGVARARYTADGEFLGVLKIGQDVTERRLARQRQQEDEERIRQELARRVTEATAELRILSRRLLLVQEEERRHLALELHDDFGQMLTGLGFTLGTEELDAARLAEAQRIVAELTERIRERSMELRPATLDSYGLLPALRWHLERYQRQTGITVQLLQEGLEQRFGPTVEITAYRIVQEALTNVARHSESELATVQLFADDVALTVSVRDHGRGFGIESKNGGSGMAGMRERAELLGGTLEIDTAPGEGVTLTAELPLEVPTVSVAIKEEA